VSRNVGSGRIDSVDLPSPKNKSLPQCKKPGTYWTEHRNRACCLGGVDAADPPICNRSRQSLNLAASCLPSADSLFYARGVCAAQPLAER